VVSSLRFSQQNPVHASPPSHTCYMPCQVSTCLMLSSNVFHVLSSFTTKTLCISPMLATLSSSLHSLIDVASNLYLSLNRYTSSDWLGHCACGGPGCQRSQS
jgi:hypothetical protein